MNKTPAQAAQLVLLRQIVARQIQDRNYSKAWRDSARRAIRSLRVASI